MGGRKTNLAAPSPTQRSPVSSLQTAVGLAIGTVLVGCARSDRAAPPADASAPTPSVAILAPANDETVSLPLTLRLAATGVEVIPASGIVEPGKGHHHLIIDAEVPDSVAVALPSMRGIVHLGSGVQEYRIDSLLPGAHRIIAIFAAGNHVPMSNVRPDTVSFVVR